MLTRLNFVCVDDSPFSENGFDWYLKNYHRKTDTVGIVHVQRAPILPFIGMDSGAVSLTDEYQKHVNECVDETKSIQRKFEQICSRKKLKCEFFNPNPHYSPGHVICDLAKKEKADAVIVGQRGLGTVSRAMLGSTSDYILHHSSVPVLVVPAATN